MKNKKTAAIGAILLSNVIWGALYPANKLSLSFFTPLWYFAIRYTLAAVLFAVLFRKKGASIPVRDHIKIAVESWIGLSLAIVLTYYGLRLSRGMDAAIIASLGPLFLYWFSIMLLKERFKLRPLLGTLLALAGTIAIVAEPFFGQGRTTSYSVIGAGLILAGILLDVLGTVLIKPYLKKYDVSQLALFRFIYAVIPIFILALWFEPLPAWPTDPIIIASLVYGLLAIIVGFPLYYYGLKRLDGEHVGVLFYIDPAVGALASTLLLQERPSSYFLGGLVCIIIGIILAESHIKKRHLLHSWHHHRH